MPGAIIISLLFLLVELAKNNPRKRFLLASYTDSLSFSIRITFSSLFIQFVLVKIIKLKKTIRISSINTLVHCTTFRNLFTLHYYCFALLFNFLFFLFVLLYNFFSFNFSLKFSFLL